MSIKDLLKKRRLELNLTMADVAKIVGVSEGTISRWESGDIKNMRRDKIVLLAKAMQTTPAHIMEWDDTINPATSDGLEENVVIYHRNGKTEQIKLSKEKMDMFAKMIEAFKDDGIDL